MDKRELVARWERLDVPQLPEAQAFEAAREELRQMTPQQLRQTLVEAGIAEPTGELTPEYR